MKYGAGRRFCPDGTISGDLFLKTEMVSGKDTPKIRREGVCGSPSFF